MKGKLVAIVDDDEFVREALPDLLGSFGLQAQSFASAKAFLAADSLGQAGCLVLDVAMPGMSGPELQLELRRLGCDIPIVFITANTDEVLRPTVMKRGAVALLRKPFSEEALLKAVNAALELGEDLPCN